MPAVLETLDLRKHYQMGATTVRALDGVSLTVNEGEFVGLLGTSGSGKSTLLNLIAGLDRASGGSLRIFDHDLATMNSMELSMHRRRNVGIIFQSFNLVSSMTALENVTLAMMFAGVPRGERESRAASLLEAMGLSGRQHHRPRELSGGEQQRVAIARALSNQPRLLLADEPTGNLDSRTGEEILDLLTELQSEHGMTLLLATHDSTVASQCQRLVELLDGRLVSDRDLTGADPDSTLRRISGPG